MRTLVFLIIITFTINLEVKPQLIEQNEIIFDNIQEMPVFPGGQDSIWCFLESNLNYDIINSDSKNIRYFIKFVIDTFGIARNFGFLGTIPKEITIEYSDTLKINEIIRVLEMLPKWEPAKQFGKKIDCWYTIPIMSPYTVFRCKHINRNNSH